MTTTTTRQDEQQAALQQAESAPGVREVLDVYLPIQQMTGLRIVHPEPVMGYATGGNI